jgi:hypothetical protein
VAPELLSIIVPAYYGRTYAEGKKITWRDGVAAVAALGRYRMLR